MADFGFDFEAPSFSLGLDFDEFDLNPQITRTTQVDDFETLIVDDSEPDSPDPHPNPNHLLRTGNRKQNVSNALEPVSAVATSCNNPMLSELNSGYRRRFQVIDSDSDTDGPSVSEMKFNKPESYLNSNNRSNRSSRVMIDLDATLPPSHRYFFHHDIRIQELVRSRLCHFSPLGDGSNSSLEQCSQSKIDYMRQFNCGESSKQYDVDISGKKSSKGRKVSRKSKNDESSSPGWVNPKFSVDKVPTKEAAKRKVHGAHHSPGQWLTGSDGKKVYVGKNGQELAGRVAYIRYKKENGAGFKKSKKKFFTKKKK